MQYSPLTLLILIVNSPLVYGQFGGFGGFGGGGNSGGFGSFGGFGGFNGFDFRTMSEVRIAHGVMASAAFVFFFPVGAIAIRILPGRLSLFVHAICQLFAYTLFIVAFGMGVWMAGRVNFGGFHLIDNHHPIIGIVIFALLFFQPILGIIHHRYFKKLGRRQFWSHAHIWLGRILITLGIINGGLGLQLAHNTTAGKIIYGVVAGVIWLAWMCIALFSEFKRSRRSPEASRSTREPMQNGANRAANGAANGATKEGLQYA